MSGWVSSRGAGRRAFFTPHRTLAPIILRQKSDLVPSPVTVFARTHSGLPALPTSHRTVGRAPTYCHDRHCIPPGSNDHLVAGTRVSTAKHGLCGARNGVSWP